MKHLLLAFLFVLSCFYVNAQNTASADTNKEDYKDDWADLRHYREKNKTLPLPAKGEERVVFLGSSIFERWTDLMPEFFANKNYINRGISGQISPQLLIRFRQDVIDLKPKAVIILAGSNDIAGSTGHITTKVIMDNIRSMTELAKFNGIKVIICAYLPVYDYPWRKGLEPANKIIALNKAIKEYAAKNDLTLLDYFSPFADEKNGQKAELTLDGVHPNAAGYRIMAKVTEEAIARALHKK
ncbi:SGNH/GDSL hydrolase family protein [Rubrolithibacter danxiaensis]|uniref:SGNH/GDSL hydrolase family protein n=1 Tax=Rubrolithibacter danxiaensis TaxID=3390805 RepID=UPI003BF8C738